MGEPKMGYTPPAAFNEDEEREKARLALEKQSAGDTAQIAEHENKQLEKGWGNEDPMPERDPDDEWNYEKLQDEARRERLYGDSKTVERLIELQKEVDFNKIPRIECSTTGHDRAMAEGYYLIASDEVAQIIDSIKCIESSGTSTNLLTKDGKKLAIPDDSMMIWDGYSEKLNTGDNDYLDPKRAELLLFIGEDEERLRYFSKERAPQKWSI